MVASGVQNVIHTGEGSSQQLRKEWFGNAVLPPLEYCFRLSSEALLFQASRPAPARVHPDARSGQFQPGLWKFDTAEFFLSRADGGRYLEVNVSPNGAWWSGVFHAPRVQEPEFADWRPAITASGTCRSEGWSCQATLPLADLHRMGIELSHCRLAVCAILQSPNQLFLTSADDTSGDPDFHRPLSWDFPVIRET